LAINLSIDIGVVVLANTRNNNSVTHNPDIIYTLFVPLGAQLIMIFCGISCSNDPDSIKNVMLILFNIVIGGSIVLTYFLIENSFILYLLLPWLMQFLVIIASRNYAKSTHDQELDDIFSDENESDTYSDDGREVEDLTVIDSSVLTSATNNNFLTGSYYYPGSDQSQKPPILNYNYPQNTIHDYNSSYAPSAPNFIDLNQHTLYNQTNYLETYSNNLQPVYYKSPTTTNYH
jgi:hypothetical protein